MSTPWLHLAGPLTSGSHELAPEEGRHARSRRLREGDEVVVFDGEGRIARARLETLGRRTVGVEVGEVEVAPAPQPKFGLATAIPKGERLSTMLQMGMQLGLEVWQPLVLDDSAVRRFDPEAPRLQRILLESCKVARRPFTLDVREPLSLDAAIELWRAEGAALAYGDREGKPEEATKMTFEDPTWLCIGPEAGFTDRERTLLRGAGACAIQLSEFNLRIETAAVAAISVRNSRGGKSSC